MRRGAVACAVIALAACGSHGGPMPPQPSVAAPAPPSAPAPPPEWHGYEVHEWGMLAFAAEDISGEALASGSPLVETAQHGDGSSYKPVLYVHLAPGTRSVTFDAEVRAPGHRFVESWPIAGDRGGDTLHWAHVIATAAPPTGCGASYPTVDDPPCDRSRDAYCEAMGAAQYEASDGACLAVGGRSYDDLFYRGTVSRDALPFDIVRHGDALVVRAKPDAPPLGLTRVRRDFTTMRVESVDFRSPGPGTEAPVPEPIAAAATDVLARLLAPLTTQARLSDPERAAFARAWRDAIVPEVSPSTFGEDRAFQLLAAARPPADAAYYWLPRAFADRVLPLHFAPEPAAVRRALLVRISLDPAPRGLAEMHSEADASWSIDAQGLSRAAVRTVVHDHMQELLVCHAQSGGGLLVLNVEASLTPSGTPTNVHVSSQPNVDALDRCVAHVLAHWTFPAPSPAADAGFSLGIGLVSRRN